MQRPLFHFTGFVGTLAKITVLAVVLGAGRMAIAENSPADTKARVVSLAPELQVVDRYLLAIPKSGFGKEYQFTASIIPQELAPTSTGLEGKIVRFELFPDGVDMYESTEGLVVTEDLPARRLLATFNIVRQDDDKVVIDFNKGMRRVFTTSWTEGASDFVDIEGHDRVLEVPESRVFEMRQDQGRLVIRQSVQLRNRQADPNLEARFEMRYFIAPYKRDGFAGKETSRLDSRYTRFFETEGSLEQGTGRVSSRIVRFDLSSPVVFYYSANTPSNYVDAVRDGILYW
ncbi:MAG TPA: hypothetical protein VFB72_18205, partial [Verrucomicrobiae bacterium]|nr:hypothetical protein [Verrucomicrobiae bacterium]